MFESADSLIHEISNDSEKYTTLLQGLILQGSYALMEDQIIIRAREKDVDQVKSVLDTVADKYEESLKSRPEFTISEEYLPSSRYIKKMMKHSHNY